MSQPVEDGTATRAHLDQQIELSRQRITSVEQAFATATQDMAGVVRQIAKLRNAGDVLVENYAKYANSELPVLREGLQAVCECLAAAEDHRQAHVSRIETQVIHPLTHYEKVCRLAKDGLKDRKAARDKEVNKQKVYDKVRRDNPNDSRKVNRAVEEMQTARQEAAQVAKKAEEHMTAYELQKLKDTKSILGDYLMSSMTFHAKALELCTLAFQNLKGVDEDDYLEEFRATLHRRPDNHSHPQHRVGSLDGSLAGESRSRENLTSSRPPLASRLLSSSSSQQQGQRDVDVDDGDDDGDEISDVNEDDLN